MSKQLRIAVVGAGIVGLATGSELARAGAEVRVYDRAEPAGAQSKGLTRIFRMAHGDARLVELARRSREGWRTWEARFGRRLVGSEGLVLSGDEIVPTWSEAMSQAGAPYRLLSAEECRELSPISAMPHAQTLFDPNGGATRARRTVDALRTEIEACLYRQEVRAVESHPDGCVIRTEDDAWQCDETILAAGIDTEALAAPLGLDIPTVKLLHSRFTFAIREQFRGVPLACWIDETGLVGDHCASYGQPVGSTGTYAVGVNWGDEQATLEVGAEEVSRRAKSVTSDYVRAVLPGLDPDPVSEIRCVYPQHNFFDHNDGFTALRRDRVTAFYGNNLFKLAPLLGTLLRDAATEGALPAEFTMATLPSLRT